MSAEHRVLRAFLVVFFGAALLLAGSTWWRKARACDATCAESGAGQGELKLSGGGRLNMATVCHCAPAGPGR